MTEIAAILVAAVALMGLVLNVWVAWAILAHTVGVFAASAMPVLFGMGWSYFLFALGGGARFDRLYSILRQCLHLYDFAATGSQ